MCDAAKVRSHAGFAILNSNFCSQLPEMGNRFLRHAQDPANFRLVNPFSDVELYSVSPIPRGNASIVVGEVFDDMNGEVQVRRFIYRAFKNDDTTGLKPKMPLDQSSTTDLRFEFASLDGTLKRSVFVEVKSSAVQVANKHNTTSSFRHIQIEQGGRDVFVAGAKFDFILSMSRDDGKVGWLIYKDDFPVSVWNTIPKDHDGAITITFEGQNFLEGRKIDFNKSHQDIVKDMANILKHGII